MSDLSVIDIGRETLVAVMLLSAPMLLVSLVVGLFISIFQAATQIHEMTLTFIPKLVAMGVAIVLFLPWMLQGYRAFFASMMAHIPQMVHGG